MGITLAPGLGTKLGLEDHRGGDWFRDRLVSQTRPVKISTHSAETVEGVSGPGVTKLVHGARGRQRKARLRDRPRQALHAQLQALDLTVPEPTPGTVQLHGSMSHNSSFSQF